MPLFVMIGAQHMMPVGLFFLGKMGKNGHRGMQTFLLWHILLQEGLSMFTGTRRTYYVLVNSTVKKFYLAETDKCRDRVK